MIMTFIITGKDGYETVKEKLVGFGNLLKIETGRGSRHLDFEVWVSEDWSHSWPGGRSRGREGVREGQAGCRLQL